MAPPSARRPTIMDVAERAGVSKSLVSLVLRDSPRVSDERRQRVLKAVEEMGFELNLAARSLATRDSGTIGVLVSDMHNPWAFDVADAARTVLEEAGHTVLFSAVTAAGRGVDQSILQAFRDLRVAGLLVVGTVPDKAPFSRAVSGGAVVFAGGGPDYIDTADIVRSDDALGMSMVVEHLIAQGHENIVHLGGLGGSVGRERVDGYSAAMEEHGLARYIRVVDADFFQESGYVAAQRALGSRSTHQRPTALACINDLAAFGAMTAADERGVEIAVTGYDNIALGAMPRLGLTTVDPDSSTIGVTGAKTLLERIHGEGSGFVHHSVTPHLVVRKSSLLGL
ncbi:MULTISPECIES: LacI family DNA-binding transcriptional regulator [Arthrobacter]|uniref:DNA-binding LacI/PurR family transcriptional regulator n=1 Tax=Arthrobacter bambusae TaxID=1338426 RepID=A0AAW8DMU8_9MICC|nr:LacI family DNA-binding transcriptional regulator [Arthrobacter bambusae]MDP9907678.1 DNA-binding LacI/PurR family transcriptional regulator [Arthrobacter bambusae]MDQ0131660.1 DNA-binding LacI/PurR family transcriptional regulator [Arthrobacter bambusae]MDQ0183072.1 DNA-binding LacI/PurR family transcriptional regulator [Arthrobacter bambusae]MDQ0240444.1 DNA-binding LacI/PurR family transcriptional regulator [Arthrobacter bambusae]